MLRFYFYALSSFVLTVYGTALAILPGLFPHQGWVAGALLTLGFIFPLLGYFETTEPPLVTAESDLLDACD